MKSATFSLINTTRGKVPTLPLCDIKEAILGKNYELSLVVCGETRSQSLNQAHRSINKPASVLSFPLDTHAGEIFICLSVARKRAREFGVSLKDSFAFLFIHGLLHLKGHDHGSTMEKREKDTCRRFGVKVPE